MRSRRFSWVSGWLLLVACGTDATLARAAGDQTADLLLRAFELRRQHRNEEALAVYEQAFALSPTPATRAQRGLAEQALARWRLAEQDLESALASEDPWVVRNRASLERARLAVGEHLAWLTVDVDVAGADVRLEGEPIPPRSETRVAAGVGVLEVRAAGHVPDVRRVSLAPSEHVHWSVTLAPLAATAPPPVASPPPTTVPETVALPPIAAPTPPAEPSPKAGSGVPALPIALGVTGVVAVATGVYFGIRTFQDRNDQRAHCVGGCTEVAAKDYSDAQTSAAISTVAIVGGAGLVAGGGVLWLLGRSRAHTTSAVRVTPMLGPGMNGVVLRGSF